MSLDRFGEIHGVDTPIYHCRSVFDVYLGLTASGYNLANPSRTGTITGAILTGDWPKPVLDYFRKARIDDGRVNPYWPRGSILATVNYLVERGNLVPSPASVRAYLGTLGNVPPTERGDDVAQWILALPEHIRILRGNDRYSEALFAYVHTVEQEIAENGRSYCQRANDAVSELAHLLPAPPLSVLTILNPLQADELADVVQTDSAVYVITSHLRLESYAHELVRVYLDAALPKWVASISQRKHLLDVVYERMIRSSYAWDRTEASWTNVFSETLARSLAAWILANDAPHALEEQVDRIVGEGFLYARPIVDALSWVTEGSSLTEQWLERCLDACEAASRDSC